MRSGIFEGAGGLTGPAAANFVAPAQNPAGQKSGRKATSQALHNFDQAGRRHPNGGSAETNMLI